MMRFWGGGVGHKSTREATDFFKNDRDPLDAWVPTNAEHDIGSEPDDNLESISNEIVEEDVENAVDGDQKEDYGCVREESENKLDTYDEAELVVGNHIDFGSEDDGSAIDPDMGYADL
jgi:hypothetical protein